MPTQTTLANSVAATFEVHVQLVVNRHDVPADITLFPWRQLLKLPDLLLGAEIELASSFVEHRLDAPALLLMLLAVLVLTLLVAIPNALAPVAHLEGIALLSAPRTELGRDLVLLLCFLEEAGDVAHHL